MSKGYHPTATSSMDDILSNGEQKDIADSGTSQRRRRLIIIGAVVAGIVVLALALGVGLGVGLNNGDSEIIYPSESYALVEKYQGSTFFDKFDYWSAADPTNGFTIYQLRANSIATNYTYASSSAAIIRPDTNSTPTGVNSVRIQSTQNYTQGLFVLDVSHMPYGCGAWPAFWTCDTSAWPSNGEIDILEGVNLNDHNQMTLHSSSDCSMKKNSRNETGTVLTTDCHSGSGAQSSSGCGVNDTANDDLSYGETFNSNGGGIYAMDWRSSGIRIWFFPRTALPTDLQVLSDDPTSTAVPTMDGWGTAVAEFPDTHCDIDSHFKNHKIIFDLTFCGDWAGEASVWNASTCYASASTCKEYMLSNPSELADAYWEIKSLNVYQYPGSGAEVVGNEYATTTTSTATVSVATSARSK